jgi:anti-sigma regulatory factor (Ser/Thr protein kinase)
MATYPGLRKAMISSGIRGYQFGVVSESASTILGVSLRCDRRAPRLARRALESALATTRVLEDARLVISELVNNAVLHSGCATDDIIRVTAQRDGSFLIISVHDPGIGAEFPHLRDPKVPEPGGYGLRIVKEIAARWGVENPDGHRVWAALALGLG